MSEHNDGRVPALKFALYLILLLVLAGATLIVYQQFLPGAILLATACLSMTLLSRP